MATSSRLCERQSLYSKHRETIMAELADWSAMYSLQAAIAVHDWFAHLTNLLTIPAAENLPVLALNYLCSRAE